jgi:sortase (surface protein transpeptidase)
MVNRLPKAIHPRGGRQGVLYLLVLTAAIGGVIAVIVAVTHQVSAPEPPTSASGHLAPLATASRSAPSPPPVESPKAAVSPRQQQSLGHRGEPLPASLPVSIDIPSIGVHSSVISIGKAADGTLAVPQPGPDLNKAAWYRNSVTPGQAGPSVIEGHVDSEYGPSVFFKLGAVRPGDRITVTRRDDSVVSFTANAVRSYPTHDTFPTTAVYGGDLARATLRLITCSNFDTSTGHYVGNTVVFAHVTAVHHPRP